MDKAIFIHIKPLKQVQHDREVEFPHCRMIVSLDLKRYSGKTAL